ncbi:MAG: hypothetical protein CMF48_03765 [Legionellales bacterium]|nr:hypothetical protein [Legionellales bacterium]
MYMFLLRSIYSLLLSLSLVGTALAAPINQILAVVNDDPITSAELDKRLSQIKQNQTVLPPEAILKEQVLTYLIGQKVQLQRAEQLGIYVTPAQLSLALQEVARERDMSESEFVAYLERANLTEEDFKKQVEEELILSRLYQKDVTAKINVTEKEIEQFLTSPEGQRQAGIQYRVRHALFALPADPSSDQLEQAQQTADRFLEALQNGASFEQLAQQYSDAQDALQGGDLGWRRSNELPSLFAQNVQKLSPGEATQLLRNSSGFHLVYLEGIRQASAHQSDQRHFRHILVKDDALYPESAILQQLSLYKSQVLEEGRAFADLAKQYSEDITTAYVGGDMGWVSLSELPDTFKPLFDTLEPGQISEPIRSPFGWHLVQRVNESDQTVDHEQLRAQARRYLQRQKFEERLEEYQQRLIAEAFIIRQEG